MLGEKFGHLGLDRLGQQGTRSIAQHLGKRVGERPWLKQLDDVNIGHGVSLLCWRSGGSNTPTIRRLLPVRPSPTSAHSSSKVCRRNAMTIASSSIDSTVEAGCFGPVGRSATELRLFHLATVFGLIPCCLARVLRLS